MNAELSTGEETPNAFSSWLSRLLEAFGVSQKKALEYLVLFVVLGTIYYCHLMRGWKQNACTPDQILTLSDLPVILLKYLIFTAWPFAVLAAFDPTWRSKDAGNVFLASYVAANVFWVHKTGCGFCVLAAAFRVIPFVFTAMIAHGLGTLRHCRSSPWTPNDA